MTRGGKEDKKKKPDTPESSTTPSSLPSVDDEVAQLLPGGASSSGRQSRSRTKKQKPVPSESSTTPSSLPSVDDEEVQLLQRSARTSSSKSPSKSTQDAQKSAAKTGSAYSSRHSTSSRYAQELTPEKSRLSIPGQGEKSQRSPSKSPSTLSQWKRSLGLSPKKSPRSLKTDNTELNPEADAKRKFPKRNDSKESSSKVSGVILKEGVENTKQLIVSDSSVKVSSDDAPQSENRLNVPEPEKVTCSPKSSKKSFLAQVKETFSQKSPERRKHEVHSKNTSPKSSIKSESSSSSASPISKKRQESSASNISSENSRSSNSKSSSTSFASNKESFRPDMRRQFLGCSSNNQIGKDSNEESSSDSTEHTRNGRQLSTDDYYKLMRDSLKCIQSASKDPSEAQASGLEIEPITERLDNLNFEEDGMNLRESKPRKRARSFFSNIFIGHRKQTSSKGGSKSQQEDGRDRETQSGAAVACSDQLVGRNISSIGSDKTDVDIQGAAASRPDPSVRRKEITRRGDNDPHGVGASRLGPSVRRKEITRRGDNNPHGVEARRQAPRNSRLFQRDRTASPRCSRASSPATRHHSLSPRCEHRNIYNPDCSKIRRIRDRRNQRKCKQPNKNINATVEEVGSERQAVRYKLHSLRAVQKKLSRLQEEVERIVHNVEEAIEECSSRAEEVERIVHNVEEAIEEYSSRAEESERIVPNVEEAVEEHSSRAEEVEEHSLGAAIKKYLSMLEEIKTYLLKLLEKIRVIIGNLDLSRLEAIRNDFLRRDNEVQDILNNMDENRLEAQGSNFSRLEVARGNFSSIVEELEEIQNNARFSLLETVPENLLRMEDELQEILDVENLPRPDRALPRLQQDIQEIFKQINQFK